MKGLGPTGGEDVGEDREGVRVEASKSLLCPENVRRGATVAVLDFLQDFRVGCMLSLAPLRRKGRSAKERRGAQAHPSIFFLFLYLSLVLSPFSSFWRIWDEGDKGALL